MPAPDWLEGLSGAFGGVTRGLTLGAEPFNAWETVRGKDLANDRSDIALRDFQRLQDAREALPDFYGNVIGATDTGNRLATSKGNRDIYGIDQSLAASRYMGDPNDAFQQTVQALGLTPADPEYRRLAAEAQSYFDPLGAIAGYDKMNVPGLQQRNLNEQAVTSYLTNYAQRVDPGAQVVRAPDGTYVIIGSDGETHSLTADQAVKAADMIASKSPLDTVERGVKLETLVNDSNAKLYKALTDGNLTPAARIKTLNDERVNWSGIYSRAASEAAQISKSSDFQTASPEQKAEMLKGPTDLAREALTQLKRISTMQQAVVSGGRMPGSGFGGGNAALPAVAPQGAPQVTAPRVPIEQQVARALGGGNAAAPWGQSAGGGGAYPARRTSPQDTGVQPIGGGGPANFNLDEYVQSLLQQAGQ